MSVINHLKQRRIDKEKNFTARNGRFNPRDGAPGSGEPRWVKQVSYGRSSREKKREKKGKRANAFRSKNDVTDLKNSSPESSGDQCYIMNKLVSTSSKINKMEDIKVVTSMDISLWEVISYSPWITIYVINEEDLAKIFCYMCRFQHWDIFNTSLNFRQFTLIF